LQDGTEGIVFVAWLNDIESKVSCNVASRRERLAYGEIEKETGKWLRGVVDDYHRACEMIRNHDAFLAREAARREREAAREAQALHPPLQTPTPAPQTQNRPRRYRQTPKQPEVVTLKRR
jgi:hypothetical protein